MKNFDIRDVLYLGGLGLVGYGLYLYAPWLAYTFCGAVVFLTATFMRKR